MAQEATMKRVVETGRRWCRRVQRSLPVAATAVVVCLVSTGLQAAERRVALVIGNGAYAESPLKNPVNDARDIRERLLGLGFDKSDIVFRENLKTAEIGPMLREFREKLNGDAVAVVFYAGHGVQVGGENFLPTVDARVDGEDDLPQQSIRLGNLLDLLRKSRTRLNLVFLDACRNNPYKRGFRDGIRGLEKMSPASGTLISYATQPGLVADDGKGRNGVFTGQLLANMAAPGLPVELMIKRVASGVYASTEGKQDPWQEGSIRGDFYFNPDPGVPNKSVVSGRVIDVKIGHVGPISGPIGFLGRDNCRVPTVHKPA
jgi:uncharacterized caspase-like protein